MVAGAARQRRIRRPDVHVFSFGDALETLWRIYVSIDFLSIDTLFSADVAGASALSA
jgi:hypothetical protein